MNWKGLKFARIEWELPYSHLGYGLKGLFGLIRIEVVYLVWSLRPHIFNGKKIMSGKMVKTFFIDFPQPHTFL